MFRPSARNTLLPRWRPLRDDVLRRFPPFREPISIVHVHESVLSKFEHAVVARNGHVLSSLSSSSHVPIETTIEEEKPPSDCPYEPKIDVFAADRFPSMVFVMGHMRVSFNVRSGSHACFTV